MKVVSVQKIRPERISSARVDASRLMSSSITFFFAEEDAEKRRKRFERTIVSLRRDTELSPPRREPTWDDRLTTHDWLIDMCTHMGFDVGLDISIVLTKKILQRTSQWLSTRAVNDMIVNLGTKIVQRVGIGAVTHAVTVQMTTRALVSAIGAASSVLTGVGVVTLIFGIIGVIYTLIDPRGFAEMLNRREIEAYVAGARELFVRNLTQNFPGVLNVEVPPTVYPELFMDPMLSFANDAEMMKNPETLVSSVTDEQAQASTLYYLNKAAEYIKNLKVNSQGQLIDLSDAAYPKLSDTPTMPEEWYRMFGRAMSSTIDYQRDFRRLSRNINAVSLVLGSLGASYAVLV